MLRFILLILFLLQIGCDNQSTPFPRCVSADNFSSSHTISLSAYYSKDQASPFTSNNLEYAGGFSPDQVTRWVDTGFVTDGQPLVVRSSGMWTSWAKNNNRYSPPNLIIDPSDTESGDSTIFQSTIPIDRVCGPYGKVSSEACKGDSCPYIDFDFPKDDSTTGSIGAPCWFNNGYGAYFLFKRPGDPDPNDTLDSMRYPKSPIAHMAYQGADSGGSGVFSSSDTPIRDSCGTVDLEAGWKIYVKILDRYYWDNAGGFAFELISGVNKEGGVKVFESVRKKIRGILDSAGQSMFENLVNNQYYKNLVRAVLTLFLLISALLYIFGLIQQQFSDLVIRILKVSLVLILISPESWNFFYNNLLSLFINGTDMIIGLINSHSGAGYDPNAPFASLDYMIQEKIFADTVWNAKMRGLIIGDFLGVFGILIIILVILCYLILCAYAFIIYLTGFIGITLLVGIMPLFFLGILFARFKSLFDGWLSQCISFSLQSILIFTLVSLFSAMIMNTYYRMLGFTVCYNNWMNVELCIFGDENLCLIKSKLFEYTPGQEYVPKVFGLSPFDWGNTNVSDTIDGNSRFTFTGGGAIISVPPEYVMKDFRYIDYPYFDPDIKSDRAPGAIVVDSNSDLYQLSLLLDSLSAVVDKLSISRLIEQIKQEVLSLQSKGSITSASASAALSEINNAQGKLPSGYQDAKTMTKSAILNLIGSAGHEGTSQNDLEGQYDYQIIQRLIKKGNLIIWSELFAFVLISYLMWQIREFVQRLGQSIGGVSPMSPSAAAAFGGTTIAGLLSNVPLVGEKMSQILQTIENGPGMWIGSKISGLGEKVGRIPIVGQMMSITKAVTMSQSAMERKLEIDKQFRNIDYAKALIGSHLNYSITDAMGFAGGRLMNKITGKEVHSSVVDEVKATHATRMRQIHDYIKGVDKYKDPRYDLIGQKADPAAFPLSTPLGEHAVEKGDGADSSKSRDLAEGLKGPVSGTIDKDGNVISQADVDKLQAAGQLDAESTRQEVSKGESSSVGRASAAVDDGSFVDSLSTPLDLGPEQPTVTPGFVQNNPKMVGNIAQKMQELQEQQGENVRRSVPNDDKNLNIETELQGTIQHGGPEVGSKQGGIDVSSPPVLPNDGADAGGLSPFGRDGSEKQTDLEKLQSQLDDMHALKGDVQKFEDLKKEKKKQEGYSSGDREEDHEFGNSRSLNTSNIDKFNQDSIQAAPDVLGNDVLYSSKDENMGGGISPLPDEIELRGGIGPLAHHEQEKHTQLEDMQFQREQLENIERQKQENDVLYSSKDENMGGGISPLPDETELRGGIGPLAHHEQEKHTQLEEMQSQREQLEDMERQKQEFEDFKKEQERQKGEESHSGSSQDNSAFESLGSFDTPGTDMYNTPDSYSPEQSDNLGSNDMSFSSSGFVSGKKSISSQSRFSTDDKVRMQKDISAKQNKIKELQAKIGASPAKEKSDQLNKELDNLKSEIDAIKNDLNSDS